MSYVLNGSPDRSAVPGATLRVRPLERLTAAARTGGAVHFAFMVALLLGGGCQAGRSAARALPPASGTDATACTVAPPIMIDQHPSLLVTASGASFLLVSAGPVASAAGPAWAITYVAAPSRDAALEGDALPKLRSTAALLLGTYRLMAEANGAQVLSVAGLFGPSGESGIARQVTFLRDDRGWRPGAEASREIERMPFVPERIDRALPMEREALEVALRFVQDLDREDWDEAWELSSAVVKAAMSRSDFERTLRSIPRKAMERVERRELVHSFPALDRRWLPGSSLDVSFARGASGESALESVQLRLDDDMQFRVTGVQVAARTGQGGDERVSARTPAQ